MLTQLFVLLGIGIPLVLAWGLGRSKPDWSKRKVALWSASPIPATAAIPGFAFIGNASTVAPENCGTVGCESEMNVGLVLLAVTGSVFVIGAILAFAIVAIVRRATPEKADMDVFE